MLGLLCARPLPWILNSFPRASAANHYHQAHFHPRLLETPIRFVDLVIKNLRPYHSTACQLRGSWGGPASVWHAIIPSAGGGGGSGLECCRRLRRLSPTKGEGTWNVGWDARPARWLFPPDSAWLLFGVCACVAPIVDWTEEKPDEVAVEKKIEGPALSSDVSDDRISGSSPDYKVTGVLADGRCLFRAIAYGACLRSGEEAPDENRQRQLADELRAQVVDELLKRREQTEWFIEGDFDAYVKEIQQPYVWGGEPELLMASHVLKTLISVFMKDRSSGELVSIADYGQEYQKDNESHINVLFHGYGHYDVLETFS